jgi:hypothetical protein
MLMRHVLPTHRAPGHVASSAIAIAAVTALTKNAEYRFRWRERGEDLGMGKRA